MIWGHRTLVEELDAEEPAPVVEVQDDDVDPEDRVPDDPLMRGLSSADGPEGQVASADRRVSIQRQDQAPARRQLFRGHDGNHATSPACPSGPFMDSRSATLGAPAE